MYEYEKNCTLLVPAMAGTNLPTSSELQKKLEDPNDDEKCKALRELIIWMTQGESYNRLLMTVIRYVVQSNNHKVKKYLQLYWEIVEKCNSDGTLKEEMILVCNALRNDLQHPNEYIRGSTLRLLCNLRFIKLIQPLIESILENLQHRHSYVRRNAVMCIYSIIKTFGIEIIPNAVDEVEKLLLIEGDISTKRNAFLVLTYCDVERSLRYILSIQDNVIYMGDVIQMVLLDLLGKIYCDYPNYRSNLLQLIINIVQSGSSAVSYEGANTLIKIGHTGPNNTIKIAIQAYIDLLLTQSDNNIRYVVLNKISKITSITSALYTLQRCFVKDILRVLLCSSCYSLRIKVIDIVLNSLLTKNNCLDIFHFLLKHLQGITANSNQINNIKLNDNEDTCNINNNLNNNELNHTYQYSSNVDLQMSIISNSHFRQEASQQLTESQQFQQYQLIIIKSLHDITWKYHNITFKHMLNVLSNFISGNNPMIVHEITQFLKKMIINYPIYQKDIVDKIISQLPFIQFSKPIRTCLWILSECNYDDKDKIIKIIDIIYNSLQPLPLLTNVKKESQKFNAKIGIENGTKNDQYMNSSRKTSNLITKTVVLEDGTYATQDIDDNIDELNDKKFSDLSKVNYLRNLILKDEDLLLIANIGVSLVKLLLLPCNQDNQEYMNNLGVSIYNKVLYVIVCFLKYCMNDQKSGGILNDTTHRLSHCYLIIRSIYEDLLENQSNIQNILLIIPSKKTLLLKKRLFPKVEKINELSMFIENNNLDNEINSKVRKFTNMKQPYQVINFRQLKEKLFSNNIDVLQINDDEINVDIDQSDYDLNNLNNHPNHHSTSKRIYPITGLNDPVYIEAIVQVQHQDVLLELIVTNQNNKAIQNVQIELYPYGNLRVIEKPQSINHLEPGNAIHVYSTAQVKSIETGILFGFVTFQTKNVLNDSNLSSTNFSISALNDIVVLNEINIDLVDFITNSNIPSSLFRQLWSEFEWENKIPIHTNCDSFMQFLRYLVRETKLSIVGNNNSVILKDENSHLFEMDENSSFFATNLYARSIFGEDALVNISLEKQNNKDEKDKVISGTVRIRSRTQGIALSLGDHIVSLQRKIPKDEKSINDYNYNHSQLLNIDFGEIY